MGGEGGGWGVRVDGNGRNEAFVKIQKKKFGGGRGGEGGLGGQGGWEWRNEAFVKMQKKKKMLGGGGGGGGGGGVGGSGWMGMEK